MVTKWLANEKLRVVLNGQTSNCEIIHAGFPHGYYKFKHGFLDAFDPLCSCSTAIKNTVYSFLNVPNCNC